MIPIHDVKDILVISGLLAFFFICIKKRIAEKL